MERPRSLWLLLPRPVRNLPVDLAAIIVMVVLANIAVFMPVIRETPLRVPIGLIFVLFVPGYAFIAALFPEQGDTPGGEDREPGTRFEDSPEDEGLMQTSRTGIDGIERVALSFGLSIAIVPLLGLVLNFTPWGIRLTPIMVAVSCWTLLAVAIGAQRRWALPSEERFRVPYQQWYRAGRTELFEPESRLDGALNILLVASILLATGSVVYAVTVPPEGEQFSELYILTEDDDEELVAAGYPTDFVRGEGQEIVVGIENHEHRTANYTLVVVEQEVDIPDNESTTQEAGELDDSQPTVHEQRELLRLHPQLAHGEEWQHSHEIAPTIVGNDTRIVWLAYVDDVPAEPTRENADYSVHLWVDVHEAENE